LSPLAFLAFVSSSEQKAKANAEIVRSNEEIKLLIEGGGSVPRIFPLIENDTLDFAVINEGKYPYLDMRVETVDHEWVERMEKKLIASGKPYAKSELFFGPIISGYVGNLPKGETRRFFAVQKKIKTLDSLDYTFNITLRSGAFQQRTHLVREGKSWRVTSEGPAFVNSSASSTLVSN